MQIKLTNQLSLGQNLVIGLFISSKKNLDLKALLKNRLFLSLNANDQKFIQEILKSKSIWSENNQEVIALPSDPNRKLIILVLSETKDWSSKKAALAVRRIIGISKDLRQKETLIDLLSLSPKDVAEDEFVRQTAINLLMADFIFNQYKERPQENWPEIKQIELFTDKITEAAKSALKEGLIIGAETNHCRILANTPGGDLTPKILAGKAQQEKEKAGPKFKVKILDENEMTELKMGGILGVSRGSTESPRFIILEYQGGIKSKKPLVFVGKGVTFDTGGLNLKPEAGIYEMHMDMSGGGAVLHAISAIVQLGWPVNIIGLIPAAENMPSGSSYRPGDILKTITGKTIEVLNTDAEGRIILADALGFAQRFKPELIVDVATLTGAAMVALGQRAIALFTSDEKLEKMAREIGEKSGDLVWPLPCWDDYFEEIKGTFGDVANTGKNRYGGAITGAVFLKQFVGKYPWIHLDIAPTMTTIDGQFLAKGASGTGVRFLVELARYHSTN